MHYWGDEWFEKNGDDLYKAGYYIQAYVRRYSGCCLMWKEKYGTIRYEHLFVPGTSFCNKTNIDRLLIRLFGEYLVQSKYGPYRKPRLQWTGSWFYRVWNKWGHKVLKWAVKKAIKKFPNVKEEIFADFDNGEYL